MSNFVILMYEDETEWKESFEYNLKSRIQVKGKNLIIEHKLNSDTLEQDLIMCNPDLIMVDHDLGEETGDDIIAIIDGNPEYRETSIYYYSGGESLDDLRKTAKKFDCQIRCFTKEGDDLDNAVLNLA